MRALITGANGLIGANLTRELLSRDISVRALTRPTSNLAAITGLRVEHIRADVLQGPEVLALAMHNCDFVFHTAAHFAYSGVSTKDLAKTAVVGTTNVIQAAALAGVRRVVVTSSSVVFGSSDQPGIRDEAKHPAASFVEPPYVLSKIEQDTKAIELAKSLNVDVVLACPTMAIGPNGVTLGPSNGIIVAYLSDPWRMTYPGGCNVVSVQDVAAGHWLLATRGEANTHYILGSENLEWSQIHQLIAELCGVDGPRIQINHTAAFAGAAYEELRALFTQRAPVVTRQQARMIGRYYWYDSARARSLGYAPRPARAAMVEACAWLSASQHISRELRASMTLHREVFAASDHYSASNP